MLENPPGPRLADALRLSGSEPNRAQKSAQKTEILGGKRSEHIFSKRNENDIKQLEK